ncbi:MAG: preprotein translocase subunit SecY, partial [Clostridia bacterium]|nr:preprotein translocase subunit SecY [Clostridia bacterium]
MPQLLETLSQALKAGDLRRRILFTFAMFVVFRVGAHVPVPGVNPERLAALFATPGTLLDFLDVFSGGALRLFTVFAMSIIPYINASIIMQLLTLVFPALEELAKEGEEGRRKLTQWTRYGTVLLGLIQAVGIAFWLRNQQALLTGSIWNVTVVVIGLTAGTVFLMWIGEQITDKGIGNGISLIVFAGIVSRLPGGLAKVLTYLQGGRISYFNLAVLVVLGVLVIAGIIWVHQGQRRVPVQYARRVVGRRVYGGQSTHIPIRVNQAGVIPVIFAASLLAFPATIAQFIQKPWAQAMASWLTAGSALYTVVYALLI